MVVMVLRLSKDQTSLFSLPKNRKNKIDRRCLRRTTVPSNLYCWQTIPLSKPISAMLKVKHHCLLTEKGSIDLYAKPLFLLRWYLCEKGIFPCLRSLIKLYLIDKMSMTPEEADRGRLCSTGLSEWKTMLVTCQTYSLKHSSDAGHQKG